MSSPPVTVILPVYNEIESIDACLESLTAQEYPGPMTIVVADGGSNDGTLPRLGVWAEGDARISVLDNPGRLQSHGLNLAARAATGEILVRADAHTRYAPDYVARSVAALLGGEAVAVGGPMIAGPGGNGRFGDAVAAAMGSPLAVGPGRFHRPDRAGPADTVYLGTFRRSDFLAAGGYRTFPSEVAEDADLYFRWRAEGRTVYLDPAIVSVYTPRRTLAGLWRQFFRYGRGKADLLYANGTWPSWRPLAPLLLLVGLAAGIVLAVATPWQWPLGALAIAWGAVLAAAALPSGRIAPLVAVAAATMHLAYGAGLAIDLGRGPGRVRRRIGSGG